MSGTVGDNVARASGVIASAGGGGKIVQVVQTYKTDVTTQAGGGPTTFYDITGMSTAITPTKESSKILVDVCLVMGAGDFGTAKVQADIAGGGYNEIGRADENGSRARGWTGQIYTSNGNQCLPYHQKFLWTPSYTLTDVLTCKALWSMTSGTTAALNRSATSTNNSAHIVGTSSLTLWEIN